MEDGFERFLLRVVEYFDRIQNEGSLKCIENLKVVVVFEEKDFVFELNQLSMVHILIIEHLHYLKLVVTALNFFSRF